MVRLMMIFICVNLVGSGCSNGQDNDSTDCKNNIINGSKILFDGKTNNNDILIDSAEVLLMKGLKCDTSNFRANAILLSLYEYRKDYDKAIRIILNRQGSQIETDPETNIKLGMYYYNQADTLNFNNYMQQAINMFQMLDMENGLTEMDLYSYILADYLLRDKNSATQLITKMCNKYQFDEESCRLYLKVIDTPKIQILKSNGELNIF